MQDLKKENKKYLSSLTIPISWLHGPQYAYVYVAQEKGFFAEEGLNVTIMETQGSEITSRLIGLGEYPIGLVSAEVAMIARSKGLPLTVVAIADKVNPSGITCHKSARIHGPKDLEGKKVGITTTSNAYQAYIAFLKRKNIDRTKINEIPISGAGTEWLAGKTDCQVLYPYLSEAAAESKKINVNSILFYDYGLKVYGSSIVANSKVVEENPELIHKITRALIRGLNYEKEHPKESLEITFKLNPQILAYKAYHTLAFHKRLDLNKKLNDSTKAADGLQERKVWEYTKEMLEELGLLENNVNIGEFFTNEFVGSENKTTPPLITVRRVFKSFSKSPILRDINFEVSEGEFVSILGASGCGKTTLLRIIEGLEKDYAGKILIDGIMLKDSHKKEFSAVSQDSNLLPWKNVKQNILFFSELLHKEVDSQKIIKEIELSDYANNYPSELSGGMKRRVALARALVTRPLVLFLDEPFGALDKFTRWKMNQLLTKLTREHKITTIMVTHDIEEALLLSDKIIVLMGKPATVKHIYHIPFKHPRDLSIKTSPQYNKLVTKLYEDFDLK